MWAKEVTIETSASREQIWKLWSDVDGWKKWDHDVDYSSLSGTFIVGTKGVFKPKKGPKAHFVLIEATPNISFTNRSSLPFTKMDFIHRMEEKDGKLLLTHRVEISGLLTFLFSRVIGAKIIGELPKAMNTLSKLALNS